MSDGKLFIKSKATELRTELDQALKKSKPHSKVKIVLKKVIANIILNNNELVPLLPDIIKLLKIDDYEIRKMSSQFIVEYGPENAALAKEAIPYYTRFLEDPSPLLRSLAIKTLSTVKNKDFQIISFEVIKKLLNDNDPEVRKASAYCVSRLFQNDPDRAIRDQLINNLNELLYDNNQIVVSNTLAALNSITETNKSLTLTIDKAHSIALISHLNVANEWCQVYILNSLSSYVPQTSDEALELIEAALPSLQHESSAVVLNAIKIIVYFCNYVKNPQLIIPSLSNRLGTSLVSLLSKPAEIQFLVLRNVILLLLGRRELINLDVEMFFCKYDDPIYIKDTKLEIIYLLANSQNIHSVIRELEEYATEIDVSMSRKAIRAFGNLSVKLVGAAQECVEVLCDLIGNGIPYIVQESAIVLKNILRKYPQRFDFAVDVLLNQYKLIDEPDAKTSLIWIVGQYDDNQERSIKIINDLSSNFKEEPLEVQYALLTAVTKLYLKYPTEGESSMLNVLKWATEEVDNPDVRDRAYIYWRLLSLDENTSGDGGFQEKSKQIILNSSPMISSDNDNIDPKILEELELNIGTLASIYLKPVQHVFRLSKKKQLVPSPALQPRIIKTAEPDIDNYNENENGNGNGNGNGNDNEVNRPSKPLPTRPNTSRVNSSSNTNHSHLAPHRNASSTLSSRSSVISGQKSLDSAGSSFEDSNGKREGFAKRLSRRASLITNRKLSKS
ncbi:adaptin N terminal region-domain-containing protein [Scheffersomyces amazonensis]|uniref:adaptin N terminal region-domain-containing protein n=1 Tax=Scheffersomyces amazonensis TaxID=1078765 RepID=UPI00315C615F